MAIKKNQKKKIPTHPDWLWVLGQGVMHPDLCFLTSLAVGHLIMIAVWGRPGDDRYQCEWHEYERQPIGHSRRGEAFWDWWSARDESFQDTPERACIAYAIAYRAWTVTHPEGP